MKKILPLSAAPALWVGTALGAPSDAAGTPPVQVASSSPSPGDQNNLVSSSGEASYRIPFEVPPGRNGAQPKIELVYGSRSPLRGGVAAGWTMPLSKIHVDTTFGRAGGLVYAVDGQRLIASSETPSVAGGITYRAHGDASYTLYEHVDDGTGGYWLARSPDGTVREYGKTSFAKDIPTTDVGPSFGSQGRWFLDRTVDVHGNQVQYAYAYAHAMAHGWDGFVDVYLSSIQYGANVNVPGSQDFARIDFNYQSTNDLCAPSEIPIGAQFDLRTGIRRYVGAKKLQSIRSSVLDPSTGTWGARRNLDLSYDAAAAACGQPHVPLRVLSSVQLTAWDSAGNPVTLPPTTFTYGPMDYDFGPGGTTIYDFGRGRSVKDNTTGAPVTNTARADIDGNGTLDLLTPTAGASGGCSMNGIPIPGYPWRDPSTGPIISSDRMEGCFGGLQLAQRPNNTSADPSGGYSCAQQDPTEDVVHERFLDVTGDGLPDLMTARSFMDWAYDPVNDGYAAEYPPSCDVLPPPPCRTADGTPAACLLDRVQKLNTSRGLGLNGAWVTYDNVDAQCSPVPDMRCGYYVMRMYKNLGKGQFAAQPTMVYSPIPLDTMMHSSWDDNGALAAASEAHAMIDVDGDGQLDAMYYRSQNEDSSGQTASPLYSVWRGDGTGHFSSQRIDWPALGPLSGKNGNVLRDMNGDGLPDMVQTDYAGHLVAYFNTGNGFEATATSLEGGGTVVGAFASTVTKQFSGSNGYNSYTVATRRAADLDGDGLTDIAVLPDPAYQQSTPYATSAAFTAYVNVGDKLMPATMSSDNTNAWYLSLLNMVIYGNGLDTTSWRIGSDVMDEDGDGLPEVQQVPLGAYQYGCLAPSFDGCGGNETTLEASAHPYRLLTKVDNGLGVSTSFSYASVRDGTVVTTTSADGAHRVQRPLQVVKEVDVASSTAPTATTTYAYENPLTAPDAFGRTGFRGFEQVAETGPVAESGAQKTVVRRFDFSVDKSGRPNEVLTLDSGKLVAIAQTTWIENDTTAANVASFVPSETRSYVCSPRAMSLADAESACIGDGLLERHVATWSPVKASDTSAPSSGVGWNSDPRVAYFKTRDRRTSTTGDIVPGDRSDETSFEVHFGASAWLALPRLQQSSTAVTAGTWSGEALLSETITAWDTNQRGLPVTTTVAMQPGVYAVTTRTFDAYGNVATTTRPNQQGASPALSSSTSYDSLGMYPIALTNELGQRVEETWDIGLGLPTEVRGPQQGTVMPKEHTTTDGLGRVVQRTRLKNVGNSAPTDITIYKAFYSDTLANHSVTELSLLDYGATLSNSSSRQIITTLDGFGRSVLEKRMTSASTSENTTRRYDAAGNMVETDVPNPAGGNPATVAYTWGFDGLGRVTRESAPLRATRNTQYDALTTTLSESPTDDSVPYRKTMIHDSFGRLVRVMEGITTGATTIYWYDGLDRMSNVTDADGVSTAVAYTLGGQRSSVNRAGSTTSYDYDLDGNRIAVHHPRPAGVSATDPAWISTWSYDALDRVKAEIPATRDLSASDQARYMTGATAFTYDEASPKFGVGRLTTVTYPFGTVKYDHSIEGWLAGETRNLHVSPDGTNMTATGRMLTTAYTPFGTPQIVWYPDDATYATSARFVTDLQGRPNRVDVGQNGNGFAVGKAIFNRNAAGYVTARTSSGTTFTEQGFTYDSAGRLSSEWVTGYMHAGDASTMAVAGENIFYRQDGNVSSIGERGAGSTIATIYYDDLQQLQSISRNGEYAGTFAYSPTGRLTAANVSPSSETGNQVVPRNVTYDFMPGDGDSFPRADVADPAAVRRLKNADGTTFASFAYDESSNLRSRTTGGVTTTFAYDGKDHLREAASPTGDEIYFYDHAGERILTYRVAVGGQSATLRHRFGTTETVTDGTASTTTADIAFGGQAVVRVTNHNVAAPETLYGGALGSLMAVLDSSKVMRARYRYAPWGEILAAEGPDAVSFDHTYEDKARDAVTGLSYFGRRYYDPLTLSWTQPDPLYRFLPDRMALAPRRHSPFTFVLNTPLGLVDPQGYEPPMQGHETIPIDGGTVPKEVDATLKSMEDGFARMDAVNQAFLMLQLQELLRRHILELLAHTWNRPPPPPGIGPVSEEEKERNDEYGDDYAEKTGKQRAEGFYWCKDTQSCQEKRDHDWKTYYKSRTEPEPPHPPHHDHEVEPVVDPTTVGPEDDGTFGGFGGD